MRLGVRGGLTSLGCILALCLGATPSATGSARGVKIDIEMAFDTTGSMASSLGAARQDAVGILEGVRAVVPDARFAVVSFRDHGNPGGEYETLQSMTTNTAAIRSALDRLHAVSNPSPTNLIVESYNLAFHRSYTDPALRWRADARKVVVVIGDAEPYGAGSAGIGGCADTHVDPDGLDVRTELAGMRAAGRTLIMIRAVSQFTSSSLDCYRSIVGLSYPGGSAQDATSADLVTPIVALVRSAVAPISIEPSLPLALPGKTTTVTLTISNPNAVPLKLNGLTVQLPAGFAALSTSPAGTVSGGTVTWPGGQSLAPQATLRIRVTARAGAKHLHGTIRSTGHFQLSTTGTDFTSSASATLHVTRSVAVHVGLSSRGAKLSGSATVTLPRATGSLAHVSGIQRSGSFLLKIGSTGRVVLRPDRYKLALARGSGSVSFSVRVATVRNVRGCAAGNRGTLTIVDRSFGVFAGPATARLILPSPCRAASLPRSTHGATIRPA